MLKRDLPSVTVKARIYMAAAMEAITRYTLYACFFNPMFQELNLRKINLKLIEHTFKSSIALEKTLKILKVQQLLKPMLVQYVLAKGQENVKSEPTMYAHKIARFKRKYPDYFKKDQRN